MFKKFKTLKTYDYAAKSWRNFAINRVIALMSDFAFALFLIAFVLFCMAFLN